MIIVCCMIASSAKRHNSNNNEKKNREVTVQYTRKRFVLASDRVFGLRAAESQKEELMCVYFASRTGLGAVHIQATAILLLVVYTTSYSSTECSGVARSRLLQDAECKV